MTPIQRVLENTFLKNAVHLMIFTKKLIQKYADVRNLRVEMESEWKKDITGKNNPNYKGKVKSFTDRKDYERQWKSQYYKGEGRVKFLARQWTNNYQKREGKCFDCKLFIKTQFHHLSYVPNIAIELCKECHLNRHKAEKHG